MKFKKIFSILFSIVTVFVCLPFSSHAQEGVEQGEYIEGEIVISSKKEITDNHGCLSTSSVSDTVSIDFEDMGITNIEEVENYTEKESLYVAEVDGDVEKICKELNKDDRIIAEPNYIFYTCDFEMPPEIANSTSFYSNYLKWYFDYIRVPEAFEEFNVSGQGVTVAVIDNGYFINHPDFPNNLWRNELGTVGWNSDKNNDNIAPIFKSDGVTSFNNTGHGSNVASIIGMQPNGIGGIGVAFGAEIMLIQAAHYVSDSEPSLFSMDAVIRGIDYAREHGADIITMSLGASGPLPQSLNSAVQRAYNAGVAVIAAAGNNHLSTSSSLFYPAAYENVIGVMAIGNESNKARLSYYSNYNANGDQYYNIVAPGTEIAGTSYNGSNYSRYNGTSQAAPIVAAAAALFLEKNPQASVQELYNALVSSPTRTVSGYYTDDTFKLLDVYDLLSYSKPPIVSVNISASDTVYDRNLGYLYGLNEGFTDINQYLSVTDGTLEIIPTANGNGTGSTINVLYPDGRLYQTISIIIFGDVNGDSVSDATDAVIINSYNSGLLTFTQEQLFAADVDFNDRINVDDSDIIQDYAIGNDFVYQNR